MNHTMTASSTGIAKCDVTGSWARGTMPQRFWIRMKTNRVVRKPAHFRPFLPPRISMATPLRTNP